MAAPMKRVTAWFSTSEFENVYQELYSSDWHLQKHAIDRIAVWKCRSTHRLSRAVECTAELVGAQLLDRGQEVSAMATTELHLRMTYALALIRFVNQLTENLQTGHFAQAIHLIADDLGIPRWIVDLRHEATHQNLPSLSMLRTGVGFALWWLESEYWKPQLSEGENSDGNDDMEETSADEESKYENCLRQYMDLQFKAVTTDKDIDKNELQAIIKKLTRITPANRKTIVSYLVQHGYLISNSPQLSALGVNISDFSSETDLSLPNILMEFWRPMLRQIHHYNLTFDLILALLNILTEEDEISDLLAGCLIVTILHNLQSTGKSKRFNSTLLYKQSCDIDYKYILEILLKKPSKVTAKILPSVLCHVKPALTEKQIEQLIKITDVYTGAQLQAKPNRLPGSAYTKNALLHKVQTEDADVGDTGSVYTQSGRQAWQLCGDAIDWSQVPLGMCPNQDVTFTNLELPLSDREETPKRHALDENETIFEVEQHRQSDSEVEVLVDELDSAQPVSLWSKEDIQTISDNITVFT